MYKELYAIKLAEVNNELGEGPVWDNVGENLYWVDILQNKVYQLDVNTKMINWLYVESYPSTIILTNNDSLIVTALDKILEIPLRSFSKNEEYANVGIKTLIQLSQILGYSEHDNITRRFNDGKADASGRFWLGTMVIEQERGREKSGLYCLNNETRQFKGVHKALGLEKKIEGTTISNGLCWDRERNFFYFIDSPTGKVAKYDWDEETGAIQFLDYCIIIEDAEGTPDGMTIDTDGNLWIAFWGGSHVACINPDTGERLYKINVDAKFVTCPTFGGPNLKTLYITTARDDEGQGGDLYYVDLDAKGMLTNRLK